MVTKRGLVITSFRLIQLSYLVSVSQQNSFSTGSKRKGSLRLSKKLPFFKMKEGSPDEDKEGGMLHMQCLMPHCYLYICIVCIVCLVYLVSL